MISSGVSTLNTTSMLTIPRYTSLLTEWTAGFASPLRRRSKRHIKLVWLIEYSQLLPKPNPCLPCGLGENIQGILDSFHFLVFHPFCISKSLCSPSKTHHWSIYFSSAPLLLLIQTIVDLPVLWGAQAPNGSPCFPFCPLSSFSMQLPE